MSESGQRPTGGLADHAFAALALLASLAIAAAVWRLGPTGPVPVHTSLLTGRVDGWSDREHVALMLLGLTAFYALGYGFMGALAGSRGDAGLRGLRTARLVIVLVALMTGGILAGLTFGVLTTPDFGANRIQSGALSLLFLIVGALIGKAAPNPLVGVRTYWTLRSRLAWDKSNRLAGRLFFWIGVLGLIATPFAPPPAVLAAVIVAVLLSAIGAVFESWRVWRADPERHQS